MPNGPGRVDASAVLAALSEAVVVLDTDGIVVEANAAWQSAFGNPALGLPAMEVAWDWFAGDGEPLARDQGPFSVNRGSSRDISHSIMGCRGEGDPDISWFRVTRTPITDPHGTPSAYVVSLAPATDFIRHLHASRVLAEAGREFRQLTEPELIASRIAFYAVKLATSPVDTTRRSSLIFIDDNYEVARVHSDYGDNDTSMLGVTFALRDHPWVETTVRTGLPLRAELDLDLLGPTVRPYNDGSSRAHVVYAPIIVDGKVVAVLTIGSRRGEGIGTIDLESISALCEISSIAITQARSHQLVLLQAQTDALTGLSNRRGFDQRVAELPRVPYAIMAIAIDDLKQVNDRHGHHAGDELIRLVAGTISEQLRRGDLVARTGGDEFLAVFVNAFHSEIVHLADRVVGALTEVSFSGRAPRVSIGCAGGAPQAPAEFVIEAARVALERAKDRGKVSMEVAPELVEPPLHLRPPEDPPG
jgi:diguanylate cyclase (GGDEF)-like protein